MKGLASESCMRVCDFHYYLINSLMQAGPAGRGVCSVDLCTSADQHLYNCRVPTVYSWWKTDR